MSALRRLRRPTGAQLAVASWLLPTARVVDVASGNEVVALEGYIRGLLEIAWSPDGESITTASSDGSARIFDARAGGQRFSVLGAGGQVFSLDWSPDATRLITGHGDGTARVWRVVEGGAQEMATLSAYDTRKSDTGVAFSPDGTRVMTGDLGITASRVWDVSIGGDAELANLPAVAIANGTVDYTSGAVDFTSDGQQLVATSGAGSVTVWDAQTFSRMRTLGAPPGSSSAAAPGHFAPVTSGHDVFSLDVSPDGQLVAAAHFDGTVQVWDVALLSPAGDLVATATRQGTPTRPGETVEVWDAANGRHIAALEGNTGGVLDLAFTADGSRLATGSLDGTVRIWDPTSGEQLLVLPGHHELVSSVAFSPDGSTLASASADGTVRVWALDLDNLIQIAERELTRTLTDEECRQFLHQQRCE